MARGLSGPPTCSIIAGSPTSRSSSGRSSFPQGSSRMWLGRADQRDAVADCQEDGHDARIVEDAVVERADRVALEDAPAAQGVVGGNQTVLGELRQDGLVVVDVALLVGVDEDEVPRAVEP